jgi:hypothetical protein
MQRRATPIMARVVSIHCGATSLSGRTSRRASQFLSRNSLAAERATTCPPVPCAKDQRLQSSSPREVGGFALEWRSETFLVAPCCRWVTRGMDDPVPYTGHARAKLSPTLNLAKKWPGYGSVALRSLVRAGSRTAGLAVGLQESIRHTGQWQTRETSDTPNYGLPALPFQYSLIASNRRRFFGTSEARSKPLRNTSQNTANKKAQAVAINTMSVRCGDALWSGGTA